MYFNFFKEQTLCVLVISTIPAPQSHITCLLSPCLRGISSGEAYETDFLPKAGRSQHLSSRTFLLHCTLDHCLFSETLLTWRFQNRILLVALVLFLLFLFLHHLFFFSLQFLLSCLLELLFYHSLRRRKQQPTPVFLPGESQGQGSLVGCCLWGRTESDTTEVTQHSIARRALQVLFGPSNSSWSTGNSFTCILSVIYILMTSSFRLRLLPQPQTFISLCNLFGASLRAQMVKRLPAKQETGV